MYPSWNMSMKKMILLIYFGEKVVNLFFKTVEIKEKRVLFYEVLQYYNNSRLVMK